MRIHWFSFYIKIQGDLIYSEMHGSWLSCLQTYEGCWVPVSASQATGCVPPYHSQGAETQEGKALSALCPLPHHTYSSPLWWEDLRAHWGDRQRLCPAWDMTARCAELEWQGMEQMALGLFCETIALLIQRRKRHKPNSSGISMLKSILHLTQRRSWQTWQVLVQTLTEMRP